MFDTVYILKGFLLCHKLESLCPNSQQNGLSNGEIWKSVGCVLIELQWLIETCLIIDVLRYQTHTHSLVQLTSL